MIRLAPALSLLLLAACARSEDASMVQPDSNLGYNRVDRVRSPEADDREPAIGQWRASIQSDRPALEFGPLGTEPLFSLLCTEGGAVLLQRHGGVPAGALPGMQVTIGGVDQQLPVTAAGGTIPMLRGQVGAGTPLMQALGTAAQPIMIRLADGTPLVMPPSPLVSDYVRGCSRLGAGGPAPIGNSIGNTATLAPTTPAVNSAAPAANVAAPRP